MGRASGAAQSGGGWGTRATGGGACGVDGVRRTGRSGFLWWIRAVLEEPRSIRGRAGVLRP